MKNFLLLTTLLLAAFASKTFAQGDAPPFVQGQSQATKSVATVIEVPANQTTKTTSAKALLETGNGNITSNPGFEHLTYGTSWTTAVTSTATATPGVNTSTPIRGKKNYTLQCAGGASGGTCTIYQDVTTSHALDSLVSMFIKSDTVSGVALWTRVNGANNLSRPISQLLAKLYDIPQVTGTTSTGIAVVVTVAASQTINIEIDEGQVAVGKVTVNTGSSTVLGTLKTTGCAGAWTTTSTTYVTPSVQTTCTYTASGVAAAPSTMIPAITLSKVPAGETFIIVDGYGYNSTAAKASYFRVTDGTNFGREEYGSGGANLSGLSSGFLGTHSFRYTAAQDNVTFTIQLKTDSAGTAQLVAQTALPMTIKVIHFPAYSQMAYSSTNANTDWGPCAGVSTNSAGWGTSPTYTFECKREGSDLWMKGRLVVGTTPTAVEGRIGLPTWNGVQLVAAGTAVIPLIQTAGSIGYGAVGATALYSLIEPSVGYVTMGRQTASTSSLTKMNGNNFSSADILVFSPMKIPINGWENSNVVVANISGLESCTTTAECTDVYSALVTDGAATTTVSDEDVEFITGNCTNGSAGNYTCTLTGFTVTPFCWVNPTNKVILSAQGVTSTSVSLAFENNAGSNTDTSFQLFCRKKGADLVPKSAKAVSSDQNVATPGVVKSEIFSFSYGTSTINTSCSASPCSYLDQIGSTVSSVTRGGTGTYTANFTKTYTKLKCTASVGTTSNWHSAGGGTPMSCSSCNSLTFQTGTSGTGSDTFGSLICHGYAP